MSIDLGFQPSAEETTKIESFALNYLRDVTPVRTGRLRSGWRVSAVGSTLSVTNNVPYAGYVENGTRKMRARSMANQTNEPTIDFAARVSGANKFASSSEANVFATTGDKALDAKIWQAAVDAVSSVKPVTSAGQKVVAADVAPLKLGLVEIGARTLLSFDGTAENLADNPAYALLDDAAKMLGISPTRYKTLLSEYGQKGSRFAVTPQVTS